jgi:hypothetical protein
MKHKACPFCGKRGTSTTLFGPKDWIVYCVSNRCMTEGPRRTSERGAWAAWDKRRAR